MSPKKALLKFSNVKNMGKPSQFFFRCTHLVHCRFLGYCTNSALYLDPAPTTTDTLDGHWSALLFLGSLH
jgi:hypothetical protein